MQTAAIGATIISAEDIRHSGVSDVNEAIRRLAGVVGRADLNGGRELTLDLRGYGDTASQNLVILVDGLRVSENELTSARMTAIPLALVDRIEIVRGSSSVLWGEGASAGVINIVLRQAGSPDVGSVVSASAAVESFDGRDVQAQAFVGRDAMAFDALLRHVGSDGFRDNNHYRQDSASAGLTYTSAAGRLQFRAQRESQGNGLPGSLNFIEYAANPRQTATPRDHANVRETRTSVQLGAAQSTWTPQIDLAARERRAEAYFDAFAFRSSTASHSTELSPRLVHHTSVGSAQETSIFGLSTQRWSYRNTGSSQNETGRQTNRALYIHTDWSFPTGTRLAAGWRSERVNKRASDASNGVAYDRDNRLRADELALNQTLRSGLDAYVRLASSFRLPVVDENRFLSAPLRPQRNRDREAGLKWAGARHNVTMRVFRQRTVDEIAFDPTLFSNVNLDPTRRTGVELEGKLQATPRLQLSATWQSLRARFNAGANAGRDQPLVAPRSATLRGSYKISASRRIDAGWQYRAAMRFGDDHANNCDKRIPSFVQLDARYAWSSTHWELAVSGTNLTDRRSYSIAFSCANGSLYPDLGRSLRVSLSRQL